MSKIVRLFTSMRKILEEESRSIESGSLEKLPELHLRKTDLFDQIEELETSFQNLNELSAFKEALRLTQKIASNNARRLKLFEEGARSAQKKLQSLMDNQCVVTAYSKDGTQIKVSRPSTIKSNV